MRQLAITVVAVVALAAGWAWAADPFPPGPGAGVKSAGTSAPAAVDERTKVAEMEALFAIGKYDDILENVKAIQRTVKDEGAKTDIARLAAESFRKKGEWKLAVPAYQRLRDRYEKGSDDYVRYDAIGEVLRTSVNGVYGPSAALSSPKPLSEDQALAEALVRLAEARIEKIKARITAMKRARSPQEMMNLYAPIADELRQARVLAPSLSPDTEQAAALAAGQRLAELGKDAIGTLTAKQGGFQQAIAASRLTSNQKTDMLNCQNTCNDLAKAEEAFQNVLDKVGGLSSWPEGKKIRAESVARRAVYTKMAPQFKPPPASHYWERGVTPSTTYYY